MLAAYFTNTSFACHLLWTDASSCNLFTVMHPYTSISHLPVSLNFRDHSNFVNCIRYSLDGTKFITVSSDKKGLIYDGKTGDKIGELSSEGSHTGSIYAVSWSPDSKQVSLI